MCTECSAYVRAQLSFSAQAYSFGILMWELLSGSSPYKGMAFGQVRKYLVAAASIATLLCSSYPVIVIQLPGSHSQATATASPGTSSLVTPESASTKYC
jgi:Protein tyrosine and serine/threonine kinase